NRASTRYTPRASRRPPIARGRRQWLSPASRPEATRRMSGSGSRCSRGGRALRDRVHSRGATGPLADCMERIPRADETRTPARIAPRALLPGTAEERDRGERRRTSPPRTRAAQTGSAIEPEGQAEEPLDGIRELKEGRGIDVVLDVARVRPVQRVQHTETDTR